MAQRTHVCSAALVQVREAEINCYRTKIMFKRKNSRMSQFIVSAYRVTNSYVVTGTAYSKTARGKGNRVKYPLRLKMLQMTNLGVSPDLCSHNANIFMRRIDDEKCKCELTCKRNFTVHLTDSTSESLPCTSLWRNLFSSLGDENTRTDGRTDRQTNISP